MAEWLIKLAIRVVVFAVVFGVAAHKLEKVSIAPRWALPLVGLVFAALNAALYWLLRPLLDLATLGILGILMPFVINGGFLYLTRRAMRPLKIDVRIEGVRAMAMLAILLTAAHGVLYLALDVLAA
jgi:uncharacterized membrane protein YvlD (DUF360 family)